MKNSVPFFLLLLICCSANAAMYSCIDVSGTKTLRNIPCKQEEQQRVSVFRRDVPKDTAKTFESFQEAAAQGDANAQSNLGKMYYSGEGVPKDNERAFKLFQKAAAQGDASAQSNLGAMYYRGEGVPKNNAKAMEWFQKAVAQGDASAQSNLGVMYVNGKGVPKDNAKAIKWFQKAAAQGNADGQYILGLMYVNGEGIPKDTEKAMELIQKSAAQGNADALSYLAQMEAFAKKERFMNQRASSDTGSTELCSAGVEFITQAAEKKDRGVLLSTQLGLVDQVNTTDYWKGIFREMLRKVYFTNISPSDARIKGREIFCN